METDHTRAEKVLDYFNRRAEQLSQMCFYVILDTARDARIHPALAAYRCEYRCLYKGKLPAVLEKAAPHIVEVDFASPFARWLIEEGWGMNWGIGFASPARLDVLKNHFRGLVRVKDEKGRTLYFRYYDPRVLRVYLPTCTAGELQDVFGKAKVFFVEGEDANQVMEYQVEDTGLVEGAIDLSQPLPG